ncbi:hypothetical protein DPX16_18868 [Anabarilius grahami]|uniref:Uncharacterized protein n=1 Tax=Anabarilius grahami TaxID=495550 RepID=A0A3N0YMC6_ANAGA|nr:hypothetical protein DPX16_18868 [Anabarilius grahami]
MASPKDPHLQARPLSSPQESNRIDLKPAQSLPACSHTAHLHEVQGCLGCTVGWRRSASVLEGQTHLKVKNTGNCGINKGLKSPCVMSMRIQIKGLKKQSCDSLSLDCLRKVAFREASLELTYSLSDPSHPSQSRACRTWAKDPRKQLSMPPLERTKEPIEKLKIKVWPFTVCIIHHANQGKGSIMLARQKYSMERLIS